MLVTLDCNAYDEDHMIRNLIDALADKEKYKKLNYNKARAVEEMYKNNLPKYLVEQIVYSRGNQNNKCDIYTRNNTFIANGFNRVVLGHYGAFLEISKDNMNGEVLCCKPGEEYRYENPEYKDKVKYNWLTVNDKSDIKIYYQKKEVSYANYKVGYFYISPYDCILIYEDNGNDYGY